MQYKDQLVLTGNVNATGSQSWKMLIKATGMAVAFIATKTTQNVDWTLFATFSRNKINNS